ncbi:MAG TPA: ABC transporter substrate-binding protein, partial [Microbacterium sp.]|nr:ABC transporter substrate-binding protein [Microbacterium sp.]
MTHSTRRLAAAGALVVTGALVLAACSGGSGGGDATGDGDSGELTPVKLQLQWLPQGQFAGYFAA